MSKPWQSIDSAPKDRPILGRNGDEFAVIKWHENLHYWELMVCGGYAEDGEWWPSEWCEIPGVNKG